MGNILHTKYNICIIWKPRPNRRKEAHMRKGRVRLGATLLLTAMLLGCGQQAVEVPEETDPVTEPTVAENTIQLLPEMMEDPLAELALDVTLEPIGARNTGDTTTTFENGVAAFTFADGTNTVQYTVDTTSDKVRGGVIEVYSSFNGGKPIVAVTDAGVGYLTLEGKQMSPLKFAKEADVKLETQFDEAAGALKLIYEDTYEGIVNQKIYTYQLKNQSLVVMVESGSTRGCGGYRSFETGSSYEIEESSIHSSIYVEEVSVTDVNGEYFLSAYLDKAKTYSTRVLNQPNDDINGSVHGMYAQYELNSAGETNPLRERLYITVSDKFLDCVYLSNGEKSAYRDTLNTQIIYDNWQYNNTYTDRKEFYTMLAEKYGMTDVLLVEHRWQRDTLDISNPAHYPASTHWGSAESFEDYISTVRENGWTLALHEDYWFIQPSETNQYWNDIQTYFPEVEQVEDVVTQLADGTLRFGWKDTSYANRSDMMAKYATIESTQIENAYNPEASFLDVNGGVDPNEMNQVTLNANTDQSRTLAHVVADNANLFQTVRDIYQGPVISEGAQGSRSFGSAYAGWLDSGSREITDCSNCQIMPDYELVYIRPLMANQGMGPPARFQVNVKAQKYDFDKYNTTCIAYGHSGFIGEIHYGGIDEMQMVNTYYMFRAIQEQYLDSNVTVEAIEYYDADNNPMELEEALRSGYDFRAAKLRLLYANGLEIYLNFSEDVWTVELNGHTYRLDKNGYAAENPELEFVQYSCLNGDVRVDYVDCKAYTYLNPRGNQVTFENGMTTDTMQIIKK